MPLSIWDWIIGAPLLALFVFWAGGLLVTEIIPFVFWWAPLYVWRNARGRCFTCNRPYVSATMAEVDQMYASQVVTRVCECGHRTTSGNRHFAEW